MLIGVLLFIVEYIYSSSISYYQFSFSLQIRKTVRETTNTSDPAGVVTYDVIRTQGTQGLVTIRWRLEDKAANDFLTSTSGELIYQPVRSLSFCSHHPHLIYDTLSLQMRFCVTDCFPKSPPWIHIGFRKHEVVFLS